jgi:hypothetical protein
MSPAVSPWPKRDPPKPRRFCFMDRANQFFLI